MSSSRKKMAYAILLLVTGVGGLVFAFAVSSDIRDKSGWPTVPGKILERGVGEPMARNARVPHVKYQYEVSGKRYVNDQVYMIRKTGDSADNVKKLVDGLPDPVPVHYNASDPAKSYLLANSKTVFWIILGMASLALLMGLLQALAIWGKKS